MTIKKSSKLDTTKTIARFVVGRSVSATLVTLIHQNTTVHSTPQKVQMYIGAYAVGSMVADKARATIDGRIDSIAKMWDDAKKKTEEEVTTTD